MDSRAALFCTVKQNNSAITAKTVAGFNIPDEDVAGFRERVLNDNAFLRSLCLDPSGSVSRGPERAQFEKNALAGLGRNPVAGDLQRALTIVLNHKDTLLGYIILWRDNDMDGYIVRDMCVLGTLKNHISLQLYRLTPAESGARDEIFELERTLGKYKLSKREVEVLYHICSGIPDEQICKQLYVAPSTFKKHLNHIYEKTQVSGRLKLVKLVEAETGVKV